MEFDKVVLEGKKYQDLVKLAKERDVYRRYAPKAELIERLLDLNKVPSGNDENDLLSDVSMPSLDISEDDFVDQSQCSLRNKNDKDDKSGMASRRSALKEVHVNSPAVQKRRKTVAFLTSEQHSPSAAGKSSTKRIVRISTPAKPIKTLGVKSTRKSATAASTPAATQRKTRGTDHSPANELESTFTLEDVTDSSLTGSPGTFRREDTFEITGSNVDPERLKREGTFEIITLDKNGSKICEVVAANGKPLSVLNGSWKNRARSSRGNVSTPMSESEDGTPRNVSVKNLCRIFEPVCQSPLGSQLETSKIETTAAHSRSWRASNVSPHLKAKSTRSSMLRTSPRKSDVRAGSISMPSSARKAFVTNRGKAASSVKPKNLSMCKTPKLTSPSVAREIQLKQQAVSAKKLMESMSAQKSKIPAPRKVPNFGEMHAKMYSKMESLVDAKHKVMVRAQEYENSTFPRCAVTTPNLFSAGKSVKFCKEERPADSRPVAARHLKLPEKSKIPARSKEVVDSAFSVGVFPLLGSRKSASRIVEKPEKSPNKWMPANRLISRLPVMQPAQTTRRSGNTFSFSNKAPVQMQKVKETIVTKAPVKKVQDITSKNRTILRNVRTNKRFELQMQHRLKSLV